MWGRRRVSSKELAAELVAKGPPGRYLTSRVESSLGPLEGRCVWTRTQPRNELVETTCDDTFLC